MHMLYISLSEYHFGMSIEVTNCLMLFYRLCHEYHEPLDVASLQRLTQKNFSDETMKKITWVFNMYQDWMNYRNSLGNLTKVTCDLSDVSTINVNSLSFGLCRFLTEVKKLDGSEFPPKTLYDMLMCVQFFLETVGFSWRLISDDEFKEVKFTLDNVMKQRTAQGIGISVHKADVLTVTDEDILWSLGLLGTHSPEVLLNTVMFTLGLSCSLCAGKEHYVLRSPGFDSQFTFMYDSEGKLYFRYVKDIGLKTKKEV